LDWYLQPWQLTITVLVFSVNGSCSASTPITVTGKARTTRVLRRFSVTISAGVEGSVKSAPEGI
jgi:hypothetical protein